MQKIPIAHIAGGEISQGAIDDNIRHAITKLASLHFTETEEYRHRVIQMGEQPDNVINAGALGVWNIMNQPLLTPSELMADLQWNFTPGKLILVTLHPATQGHNEEDACKNMLLALQDLQDYNILITYPNNDAGHQDIIKQLNDWCPQHPNVKLVKSLGMRRYLSMLRCAAVVVGNSSSGIIEVPSMGIPTVDIGSRQRGRVAAHSVIHCGASKAEIADAIALALSPSMQALASRKENPYYNPNTVSLIQSKLLTPSTSSLLPKTFYDLPSKIQ